MITRDHLLHTEALVKSMNDIYCFRLSLAFPTKETLLGEILVTKWPTADLCQAQPADTPNQEIKHAHMHRYLLESLLQT